MSTDALNRLLGDMLNTSALRRIPSRIDVGDGFSCEFLLLFARCNDAIVLDCVMLPLSSRAGSFQMNVDDEA